MPYAIWNHNQLRCRIPGGYPGQFKIISTEIKEALPNIFGLSAITMGISLIIMLKSLSAVVLALIVGTVIGELLNLEDNLLKGLHKLEQKLPVNLDDEQMDVLISMIILFCFSGTGVFGAMNSAMTGDHSILYAKLSWISLQPLSSEPPQAIW